MTEYKQELVKHVDAVRKILRENKPGDRSDEDRKFAICITEIEKYKALMCGLLIHKEIINE